MTIFEKVLKSDWGFYLFLGMVYISCFFIVSEVSVIIKDYYKTKTLVTERLERDEKRVKDIQTRIDTKAGSIKELQEQITERSSYRWHSYDMESFCVLTERINKGFKCPDITGVVEYDPDRNDNLLDE